MMKRYHGITLVELLVAIGITLVVVTLLGYPIIMAFGYIQKARARADALRAGQQAVQQLQRELNTASYIYDLPPDGSFVTFLKDDGTDDDATALGMPMTMEGEATLVRYAQVLDFPWYENSGNWVALKPNYARKLDTNLNPGDVYDGHYSPFHDPKRQGYLQNPFILGRYAETLAWASCDVWSILPTGSVPAAPLKGEYLTETAAQEIGNTTRFEPLWRWFRNNVQSITPYGDDWDVPRFQATPLRQQTETLTPVKDMAGRRLHTVFMARYPLWGGRNSDLDLMDDVALNTIFDCTEADIRQWYPLYPLGVNPYGYQIKIFDKHGTLVYGPSSSGGLRAQRHVMEWPPVRRAEVSLSDTDWYDAWYAAVMRQRHEGRVVAAQPLRITQLYRVAAEDVNGLFAYRLPTPEDGQSLSADPAVRALQDQIVWDPNLTYRVTLPEQMEVGNTVYRLVDKNPVSTDPDDLPGPGEYCLKYKVAGLDDARKYGIPCSRFEPDWGLCSRLLLFGENPTSASITSTVFPTFDICDLQPGDVVVATYTTKAVLDIALTVSRRDGAAKEPEQSRQDATTVMRVEARNALKRMRENP
jgi:type II secretory pathway pseudopilin PulG